LPRTLPNGFLEIADVVKCQLARLDELLHHRLRPAAEESQDGEK